MSTKDPELDRTDAFTDMFVRAENWMKRAKAAELKLECISDLACLPSVYDNKTDARRLELIFDIINKKPSPEVSQRG